MQDVMNMNIFMMCEQPNERAMRTIPEPFTIAPCEPSAFDAWKRLQIHPETGAEANAINTVLDAYRNDVYDKHGDLFFSQCFLVYNEKGEPVGTCAYWKAYGAVHTIHWLKVLPAYEGLGIGRALLSHVMREMPQGGFPLYLHTHPTCIRALSLYADLGFSLLSDPIIGTRRNDVFACMPFLKQNMEAAAFKRLHMQASPSDFLQIVSASNVVEF